MRTWLFVLLLSSWVSATTLVAEQVAPAVGGSEEVAPAVGGSEEDAPAIGDAQDQAAAPAPAAAAGSYDPSAAAATRALFKNAVRAPAGADGKVVSALELFCKKWMGFLAKRELDNKTAVAWKETGVGVEGQYVAYGTDYDCQLRDNADPKAVPIALLKYYEYIYRRRGNSAEDAMATAPDVLETTEVTEIFRYTKGEWVY